MLDDYSANLGPTQEELLSLRGDSGCRCAAGKTCWACHMWGRITCVNCGAEIDSRDCNHAQRIALGRGDRIVCKNPRCKRQRHYERVKQRLQDLAAQRWIEWLAELPTHVPCDHCATLITVETMPVNQRLALRSGHRVFCSPEHRNAAAWLRRRAREGPGASHRRKSEGATI